MKMGSDNEIKSSVPSPPNGDDFGPDPVQVLVDLAKKGEIDPWDIDLTQVTEKFLEHIESLESQDLRVPARTLLYASILLRMKSDSLDEEEDDDFCDEPFEEEGRQPVRRRKPKTLPKPPIRRRTKRPVTLNELISELKKAERVAKRRSSHKKEKPEKGSVEKAVSRAHEEGIEDRIRTLRTAISLKLEGADRVAFKDVGKDVLDYVSVLFMAGRREIWIEQETFFGELYLKKRPKEVDPIVES